MVFKRKIHLKMMKKLMYKIVNLRKTGYQISKIMKQYKYKRKILDLELEGLFRIIQLQKDQCHSYMKILIMIQLELIIIFILIYNLLN